MRTHFIAIGGSAMHNLALALHNKGYQVTGSDDAIFEPSKSRLDKKGILPVTLGWFPEKITSDVEAVILGMHAKADNPELLKAQELGLKIYSYPEFLFEQSKDKTRVVIGGSHGKTTITSMILHVMHYHNIAVDYMVGAQLEGFETMVHLTEENDFIVLEGDEYLSSPIDRRPKFHLYQPNIALISGIAWDHINVFPTYENYVEQFEIFIGKITNGGILVYNEEDPEVKRVAEAAINPIRKMAYHTPKYSVQDGVTLLETPEGDMPIEIFGAHNLNNLAGAKWICQNMGVDEADFYEAIASFKGEPVTKGTGRFGPFIKYQSMFINVPKRYDFENLSQNDINELIEAKLEKEANRYIQQWEEEKISIENARWGPIIKHGKNIFKIPKNKKEEKFTPEELADVSLEEVKKWITAQDKNAFKEKPKKAAAKKPAAKKPAVKKAPAKKAAPKKK